jgi:hypothetical protein
MPVQQVILDTESVFQMPDRFAGITENGEDYESIAEHGDYLLTARSTRSMCCCLIYNKCFFDSSIKYSAALRAMA